MTAGCKGNCQQGHKACPHPTQCEAGRMEEWAEDHGILACGDYSEPETSALVIEPMTTLERVVFAAVLVAEALAVIALIASCIT